MKIEALVRRYERRVESRTKDITEYKQSNDAELQNAVPILEKELAVDTLILSALQRQETKKKLFNGVDTYHCPNCNEEMESDVEYCQYCGQKTLVE